MHVTDMGSGKRNIGMTSSGMNLEKGGEQKSEWGMRIEEEGAEWGIRKRTETEKEEVEERARLCYLAIELYNN